MDKNTQKNYEEMYHSNIEQIIEMVGDCERLSILAGFYAAKLYDSDKEKARERFELLEVIQKNFQSIHDELRKRRKLFDEEEANEEEASVEE